MKRRCPMVFRHGDIDRLLKQNFSVSCQTLKVEAMTWKKQAGRMAGVKLAAIRSLALVATVLLVSAASAQQGWHYTLEQTQANQQAQFCADRQAVLELVRVFEEKGPRRGFAALLQHDRCATRVESFTPREIVRQVTVDTESGDAYVMTFVEVLMSNGTVEFLVTSREVHENE